MPKPFNLWEDIPNPMSSFLAILHLLKSLNIIHLLCLDETPQVITGTSSQGIHKALRQADILHLQRIYKELRHLLIMVAGNTTAYTSNQEEQIRMLLCKGNKPAYSSPHLSVLTDILAIVHRYGIALALQSLCLTPYGTKALSCSTRGTTSMIAQGITAKDKDLPR